MDDCCSITNTFAIVFSGLLTLYNKYKDKLTLMLIVFEARDMRKDVYNLIIECEKINSQSPRFDLMSINNLTN